MNCYLLLDPNHVPQYSNTAFHRIARYLATTNNWYIGYVGKKNKSLSKHRQALHNANVVICCTDFMMYLPREFNQILSIINSMVFHKKVLFICDVREDVMKKANVIGFDLFVSASGNLLPEYKNNPRVFIPNPGFFRPMTLSLKDKRREVFVPMHHHSLPGSKPPRHVQLFYASRIALCQTIYGFPKVRFQTKLTLGKDFEEPISNSIACVTAVPSADYPYIISKLFEIMSLGSLLIACTNPATHIFNEMGFYHTVHYMEVTPENVKETIEYVLDPKNNDHVLSMIQNAHRVVNDKHLACHRAEQLQSVILG